MRQNADPFSREENELLRGWILQGAVHDGADPGQAISELLPPPFHAALPVKYPFGWPVTAVQVDASGEIDFAAGYREIQSLVVGTRGGEVHLVRTDTGNALLVFQTGSGDW